MTKACVICDDTGRIPAWYALPLWFEQVIEERPFDAQDEDRVYALHDRLDPMNVKCPYCRGAGAGVGDYPCPVCYRHGTTSAWESATLLMVRCPHCLGSGISGWMPGTSSACVVCRTTGEVPVLKAVQYDPELWWEFFVPYASFENCLYESGRDLDRCLDHFDLREEARPGRSWSGLDLTFENLSGLDLRRSNFAGTRFGKLHGSNLSRSSLDGARIESAPQANFSRASLRGARLSRAALQAANFRLADLEDANLRLADLTGARFDGALLGNADLVGAVLTDSTIARAAGLKGTNLCESTGLTSRQRTICERKGAVYVAPPNADWREEYEDEEDDDWLEE